jgi:hypothetical protein
MRKNVLCPAVFASNQVSVRHGSCLRHICIFYVYTHVLLQYRSALGLNTGNQVEDPLFYAVILE